MSGDDLLARADRFAEERHRHHFRNDGVTPYVEHPRAVMAILRHELGVADAGALAAALLHDTIEDTRTDYDDLAARFGRRVAEFVAALTKDKRLPEPRREREYFARLARSPLPVKLCKIADTIHNLRDANPEKRPKALLKARRLLRTFARSRGAARAVDLLRGEIA